MATFRLGERLTQPSAFRRMVALDLNFGDAGNVEVFKRLWYGHANHELLEFLPEDYHMSAPPLRDNLNAFCNAVARYTLCEWREKCLRELEYDVLMNIESHNGWYIALEHHIEGLSGAYPMSDICRIAHEPLKITLHAYRINAGLRELFDEVTILLDDFEVTEDIDSGVLHV